MHSEYYVGDLNGTVQVQGLLKKWHLETSEWLFMQYVSNAQGFRELIIQGKIIIFISWFTCINLHENCKTLDRGKGGEGLISHLQSAAHWFLVTGFLISVYQVFITPCICNPHRTWFPGRAWKEKNMSHHHTWLPTVLCSCVADKARQSPDWARRWSP